MYNLNFLFVPPCNTFLNTPLIDSTIVPPFSIRILQNLHFKKMLTQVLLDLSWLLKKCFCLQMIAIGILGILADELIAYNEFLNLCPLE